MKIKETLTLEDRSRLLTSNSPVGIFSTLFSQGEELYKFLYPLCLEYYTLRSGNKTVSPLYCEYIELIGIENIGQANTLIANSVLRPKFLDKWNRIYDSLKENYNILDNNDYKDHKTGISTDTITYGSNVSKDSNTNETFRKSETVTDNGKTGTKETTTTNKSIATDVYGFNSANPVGDNIESENGTTIVTADPNQNTSFNERVNVGNDSKEFESSDIEKKTGADVKDNIINSTITRSGRDVEGSKLIDSEISLRNKYILFDIIYRDIDSVVALQIYV